MFDRLSHRITRSMNRAALRQPSLDLFAQIALVLLALALLLAFQTARAQDSEEETATTTTTTKTVKRKGAAPVVVVDEGKAVPSETNDFIVTAKFGSTATSGTTGCKTEALSKDVIRELKGDCNAWMKDRKAELKNKFHTGTCQEQCSDCGMSLQRCTVTGEVHYSK